MAGMCMHGCFWGRGAGTPLYTHASKLQMHDILQQLQAGNRAACQTTHRLLQTCVMTGRHTSVCSCNKTTITTIKKLQAGNCAACHATHHPSQTRAF
eukprot:scaffold263577_cov21-Tisochrysis_lutea.AAC.1